MINTEELKIGNWVSENGKFIVVNNVWDDRINVSYSCGDYAGGSGWDSETRDKEIDPIPIVPETIRDCGFTEIEAGRFYTIKLTNSHISVNFYSDNRIVVFAACEMVQCKYIHELQNLYQSLTGKDLPITWTPWQEDFDVLKQTYQEAYIKLKKRIENKGV